MVSEELFQKPEEESGLVTGHNMTVSGETTSANTMEVPLAFADHSCQPGVIEIVFKKSYLRSECHPAHLK